MEITITIGDPVWSQCHMALQQRIEYLEDMILKFPRSAPEWEVERQAAFHAMRTLGDKNYA